MQQISRIRLAVLSLSVGATLALAPVSVEASVLPVDDAASAETGFGTTVLSRRGRGRDDGAGHIRGGGRGRGADDAPGDDRGGRRGRGADDGPNHTWNILDQGYEIARRGRGKDDAAGDKRGGRRADDGAGHA